MKLSYIKKNYISIIAIVLFLVAVVLATIYDLQINIFLNNKENTFAYIFKVFAEFPAFILLPFCINIFAINLFRTNKVLYKFFSVSLSILSIFFWYVLLHKFLIAEFIPNTHFAITLSISLLINCLCLFLMNFIKQDTLKTLLKLALVAFISIVLTALITQIIKLTFGRVRFRDLNSDHNNFTRWYVINGFTGNKSFVSGHTSAAGTVFLINYLPDYFKKTKKLKPLFIFISLLYVALSGLARIIIGAHYLSDVLFGALLAYLVFYTTNHFIINKNKNKEIN